ncbi:MAG: hypothetical protein AAF708_12370 [Deinococcota bacterium]
MQNKSESWKEKALASFGSYLDRVAAELGDDVSIVDIETALENHYQEMMSETMQILADEASFPP